MRSVALPRSSLLAPGLVLALVGGCTSLLGVDGDYAVDDGDGAGNGGATSITSSAADTTSSAVGGGEEPATTTAASSGSGDGGAGGEGGGSSPAGGMGGAGGGPPCDGVVVECVDEVLVDQVGADARRPHLVPAPGGSAVLAYLTGPDGFVWAGLTDGNFLEGEHVPGTTADDVAPLDALDLVLLEDGFVSVPSAGDVPPLLDATPLGGGGPFGLPLFAARTDDDGTIRYVVAEADRSVYFACPAGVACAEVAPGCEVVGGRVAHALDRSGDHVLVARACGPSRELRIDRESGAPLFVTGVGMVAEVAIGQSPLPDLAFALTLEDVGPNRRVAMTRFDGSDQQTYTLDEVLQPAHDPALEVGLGGVVGVWVEAGDDGPRFRILRCDPMRFECAARTLQVLGPALTDPRGLTMTATQAGVLLAWEDGADATATVRFALLQ